MTWTIKVPIKDGKPVTDEITFYGTLPEETEVAVNGHSQEGIGGYDSIGVTANGMTAYSSVQAKSNV